MAFVNQGNKYDLNFMTQIDADQNVADIDKFMQENQDFNYLQDEQSNIPNDNSSDALSQCFDLGLGGVVDRFYGSHNGSKVTDRSRAHGSNNSHLSSGFNSKIVSFGGISDVVGEGKSLKNIIDSSLDLTSLTHSRLNAKLRQEQMAHQSLLQSSFGSKVTTMTTKGSKKDVHGKPLSKKKKQFE